MVEKATASVIKAEILNLEQNKIKLKSGKIAAVQMLSVLTGKNLDENSQFIYSGKQVQEAELHRPELQLFASQARNNFV